jgi:hypothetical protein
LDPRRLPVARTDRETFFGVFFQKRTASFLKHVLSDRGQGQSRMMRRRIMFSTPPDIRSSQRKLPIAFRRVTGLFRLLTAQRPEAYQQTYPQNGG